MLQMDSVLFHLQPKCISASSYRVRRLLSLKFLSVKALLSPLSPTRIRVKFSLCVFIELGLHLYPACVLSSFCIVQWLEVPAPRRVGSV